MYAAQNLWISTVATAPSPATSGTTLIAHAGDGAYLTATPPFPVTIWAAGASPSLPAGNVEIGLCTAVSTDTLTITRAQESTSARTIVAGDQIAATWTAASVTSLVASTRVMRLILGS